MVKKRRSLWVSPESIRKLVKLQGKFQEKNGQKISMQDVVDRIIQNVSDEEFENKVLRDDVLQKGLRIKFDEKLL